MNAIRVVAYAKVNLSLEVLGKRPDGFHEVRSVMQSISLADELLMEKALEFTVECSVPELSGEGNLAASAAEALMERHFVEGGARIRVNKGIPIASGLGGASADAAAVLLGLSALYDMKLQPSDLQIVATKLGADVPFFLAGGAALVKGRGHLVYPLPDASPRWLVLLVPSHSVEGKTATLYRKLTPESWSTGERTERLAEAISHSQTIPVALLGNVFEGVASSVFPGMDRYREAMLAAGCPSVHLSGAGSAIFSMFESETEAHSVASHLTAQGFTPLVARTLASRVASPVPTPAE